MKNARFYFYFLLFIFSVTVFVFTIGDIIWNMNASFFIFILYILLFISIFVISLFPLKQEGRYKDEIQSFHQTLSGRLFHFKCPSCQGIFALKESMYNNDGATIITCPDCGNLGRINASPPRTLDCIPQKKSKNVLFKCGYCGERLWIWAEGTELYPQLQVFSCPYCGRKRKLKQC